MEKTFEQCCDEVAKKWDYKHGQFKPQDLFIEAAELYANSKAAQAWDEALLKSKEFYTSGRIEYYSDAIEEAILINPYHNGE